MNEGERLSRNKIVLTADQFLKMNDNVYKFNLNEKYIGKYFILNISDITIQK